MARTRTDRIGFSGTFQSPELEARYREYRLADHSELARRLVVAAQLSHVFVLNDYRLFATTGQFWTLLGVRAVLALASIAAWMAFRRAVDPARFDRTVLLWALCLAAVTLYVDYTRPPGLVVPAVLTLVLVLVYYTIQPAPLVLQAIPATAISVGYLALSARLGQSDATVVTLLTMLLLVNLLGVVTSQRLHRWTRLQFAALRREREMRATLEASEGRLRDSEARMAGIVESAMDAIIVIDARQQITLFNTAAERMFGCAAHDALGRSIDRFIPQRFREAHRGHIAGFGMAHITTRSMGQLGALWATRTDGAEFPIEASISQAEVRGEKMFSVIIRDVSERQRAETMRMRLEEELRQAQKMEALGRLVGGVAHDFNNLLTTILGNTELLATSVTDRGSLLELQDIRAAGERAAQLVAQLMVFSRRQQFAREVIEPNTVLRNLERMAGRLIGENVALHTAFDPELKPVRIDPGQLEQVVLNLVLNARDAMPGGGDLTIETDNVVVDDGAGCADLPMPPGPYVRVSVRDTGHGMDASTKERIFEPFFTTKPVGQGTGLGLATVYGIVKQGGGYVVVDSAPGRGSLFEIYLPPAEEAVAEHPAAPGSTPLPRGTETLLLVEDESEVRALATRILERYGYRVLCASNGAEALATWERSPDAVQLLLTDLVMPQLGGEALVTALRAQEPSLKVVYMSACSTMLPPRPDAATPANGFLQKPFTVQELVCAVRACLDGRGDGTALDPGARIGTMGA